MAITISKLQNLKEQGKKFATITAYDASFANIFDKAEVAAILIGDSLGMTIQGNSSTLQVTIEEVAYHTKCVSKGRECFNYRRLTFYDLLKCTRRMY